MHNMKLQKQKINNISLHKFVFRRACFSFGVIQQCESKMHLKSVIKNQGSDKELTELKGENEQVRSTNT